MPKKPAKLQVVDYAQRSIILLEMGFVSYWEYLASPLWFGVRRRAYIEHGSRCVLCRDKARQIHHLHYGRETLQGETLEHLAPVCEKCHERVEFNRKGVKRTVRQALREFHRLRKKRSRKPVKKNHKRRKRCATKTTPS